MLRVLPILLVLVGGVACDSTAAPLDAQAIGDAGADAGPPCEPPADDPFACEDLTPDPSCDAHWVVGATGHMITAAGDPVESGRAQFCVRLAPDDRLVCLFPPQTNAAGEFAIIVPEELRCLNRAAMRAIAPGQPLGTSYCPVEFEMGNAPIVELSDPYVLHPVEPAVVPPVGDEIAQRDVTFDGGLVLTLAPVDFASSPDYEALAGAPVDVAATACFRGDLALNGAYVFSPEVVVEAGAAVSIPNADGLAAGSVVDLYVLGGLETRLLDGTMVEEGELAAIGPATVNADGSAILSDPDTRLPYLSWLVWRAR